MTEENIWTKRGFRWNEKEQCYERPVKKTERQGAHVFNLPEQAGSGIQESVGAVKKRTPVRSKGNAGAIKRDNNKTERQLFINFRFPNYKRRDLDGAQVSLVDQMVHAGIIPDDSISEVQRVFVGFTISEDIGVDIIIIEYENEGSVF